jgi:hypothetical protein
MIFMEDLIAIQGKSVAELREIAKVLGITEEKLSKKELIEKIAAVATAEASNEESVATEAPAPQKRKRARLGSVKVEPTTAAAVIEQPITTEEVAEESPKAEVAHEEEPTPQPKKRGRKPKSATAEVVAQQEPAEVEPEPEPTLIWPEKRMYVGTQHAGETWRCVLGDVCEVEIDAEGMGCFPASASSMVALYLPQDGAAALDHIPIVMPR